MPVVCVHPDAGCTAALTRQLAAPIFNEFAFCLESGSVALNPGHKMSLEIADWNLYPYAIVRHFDWQATVFVPNTVETLFYGWGLGRILFNVVHHYNFFSRVFAWIVREVKHLA